MVTPTTMPVMLSDHLLEALAALGRARKKMEDEKIIHRPAVLHEITQAELAVSRVLGLIAGCPEG
jgi:hypothetical protein